MDKYSSKRLITNEQRNKIKIVSSIKSNFNKDSEIINESIRKNQNSYNYCYMCTSTDNYNIENKEYPYDPYSKISSNFNNDEVNIRERKLNKGFFSGLFSNFKCGAD